MIEFKSIYSDVNVTSDVQRQHAYKFKPSLLRSALWRLCSNYRLNYLIQDQLILNFEDCGTSKKRCIDVESKEFYEVIF